MFKLFFIIKIVKYCKWRQNNVMSCYWNYGPKACSAVIWVELQTPRPYTALLSWNPHFHKIPRGFLHFTICIMNSHSPISSFHWPILFLFLYYFETNLRQIIVSFENGNLKKVLVKCANEVNQTNKLPTELQTLCECLLQTNTSAPNNCHVGRGHCGQRAEVTCLLPWGKQGQEKKAVWLRVILCPCKGWKIRVLCPLLRHRSWEVALRASWPAWGSAPGGPLQRGPVLPGYGADCEHAMQTGKTREGSEHLC